MAIDIGNIPFSKGAHLTFVIYGILIPPLWFIHQFEPAVFKNMELIKLLILGIAIGMPVFFINVLWLTYMPGVKFRAVQVREVKSNNDEDEDKEEPLERFSVGSLISMMAFYPPCIFSFFLRLTFEEAARSVVICEIIWLYLYDYFEKKRLDKVQYKQAQQDKELV